MHYPISNLKKKVGSLEAKIKQVLAQLGLILENGIARLQEIITGKLTTNQLCVDDICVTRDEFKSLLEQKQVSPAVAPAAVSAPAERPAAEITPSGGPAGTEIEMPATLGTGTPTPVESPAPASLSSTPEASPAEMPAPVESPVAISESSPAPTPSPEPSVSPEGTASP